MNHPLTVELVNQSDWWLPWLPVLGSMAVALVAFIGVVVSNRTNRAAIDASDQRADQDRHDARTRDFRTWQRDTTLEISATVVQAALEGQEEYFRIAHNAQIDANDPSTFKDAARVGGVVGAATAKLMIVGAHDLADASRSLRSAMNSREIVLAVKTFNRYIADVAAGAESEPERQSELRLQLDERLEIINQARGRFGEAAEAALRQTTELPTEELDDVRPRRFGRRS